jgi:hypothetical protein
VDFLPLLILEYCILCIYYCLLSSLKSISEYIYIHISICIYIFVILNPAPHTFYLDLYPPSPDGRK